MAFILTLLAIVAGLSIAGFVIGGAAINMGIGCGIVAAAMLVAIIAAEVTL
jgi:hypothetical protein